MCRRTLQDDTCVYSSFHGESLRAFSPIEAVDVLLCGFVGRCGHQGKLSEYAPAHTTAMSCAHNWPAGGSVRVRRFAFLPDFLAACMAY